MSGTRTAGRDDFIPVLLALSLCGNGAWWAIAGADTALWSCAIGVGALTAVLLDRVMQWVPGGEGQDGET